MRPNESGITRASMSHTIGSLNDLRIFVARSSTDLITCDTIRKRSKACSIPFFELDVELFMRGYIVSRKDFQRVRRHHWYANKNGKRASYAVAWIDGAQVQMHKHLCPKWAQV